MNKFPVYAGAIPLDVNILQPQRATEIALGFLMQAAFGTGTVIDGLAVTQTVSPSMGVLVGPGAVIVATTVDTVVAGFGSLPVDNNPLTKIGINLTPTTLTTLTAPGTAGQSQNTLVEAQFLEVDGLPAVLPYYNSANPAIPFTGPANAGTPNNTARTNTVQLQYKQGTAAATGSQLTPAPDAGWTGIAVITIANGQSSVLNANITRYVNAPIVPTKLPALRIKLTAPLSLYVSATGNDLNSGLSAAVPFATLQAAWNTIVNSYDAAGFNITVNVANGTYTTGLLAQGAVTGLGSGNTVTFIGNTTTPTSCIISATSGECFKILSGANVTLSGFQVTATGTGGASGTGNGIYVSTGATVAYSFINFAACAANHVWANGSCTVQGAQNYTISGGAATHWQSSSLGVIGISGAAITLTGTPAFPAAFAAALSAGVLNISGNTFSGAATGTRFNVSLNGVIGVSGAGPTYLPGSIAGTSSTGGQYS